MHKPQDSIEIVDISNVAIKYVNRRRDDLKSMTFNLLSKKNDKKKEFWALKDISFKGYEGEIIGIIGSNGAGKSTICKVISNLLKPDKGSTDISGEVSALLSLGTGFNKELSGKENIYLNGMMLGFTKKQVSELYPEIAGFSELEEFLEQPIKYYSSGMKSRLGFSIASMLKPEILVLDEVLNTGDMKFNQKAAAKMKEIVKNSKIVLIVSHNINFIEKNCTKAIWINEGQVEAQGDPVEVIHQYKAKVVKNKGKKKLIDFKKTKVRIGEETIIQVSNVGVEFSLKNKNFRALRGVSFTVKKGEIVGIIGHNGAGKSTLCKVLSKILNTDEGFVKINGEVASLLSFGTGFNKELSGADNIYLNGLMLGIPKKRITKIYNDIVTFAELEKFIDQPVKNYSTGMRSRLGFSIATMLEPDVLIIDEALSAGDLSFYEKATERIQEVITTSKAVIVVTHSMDFVEKVCTRAIWLEKGELQYDGDPSEAVAKYTEAVKVVKQKIK